MSEKAKQGKTGDPLAAAFRELERSHDVEQLSPELKKKMGAFDLRKAAGNVRTQSAESAIDELRSFQEELAGSKASYTKPLKFKSQLRMK